MDERYYSVDPQPYQVARGLMIEDRAVWTFINLKILCFEVIHCVNMKAVFSNPEILKSLNLELAQ